MTPQDKTNFRRLTNGLRCVKVDFNYAKTRKLLDPNWNGYTNNSLDIEKENCPLHEANLVTSQHIENPDKHRVLLDIDNGAIAIPTAQGIHMRLNSKKPIWYGTDALLYTELITTGIASVGVSQPNLTRLVGGEEAYLDFYTHRDFALIPSSTPGHRHLILDVDLTWRRYKELLDTLVRSGILEPGYVKASYKRGWTAIRPPWVKK